MVQEFNVVRCFACETFQVDQVKKSSNKWSCKICNEKQSVKQIFFQGNGKECRLNCQTMNMKRLSKDKEIEKAYSGDINTNDDVDEDSSGGEEHFLDTSKREQKDKWSLFIEEKENVQDESEDELSSIVLFRGEEAFRNSKKRKQKPNLKNIDNSHYTFGIINEQNSKEKSIESFRSPESSYQQNKQRMRKRKYEPIQRTLPSTLNYFTTSEDFVTGVSGNQSNNMQCNKYNNYKTVDNYKNESSSYIKKDSSRTSALPVNSKWTKFLSVDEEELSDSDNETI